MFSAKEFIEASRNFVCVRLETYESKEHEALIRKLYGGKYTNTVFCVLAPDGETKLTRAHRAPGIVLGNGRPGQGDSTEKVVQSMAKILEEYPPKGDAAQAVLQDFNSYKQGLNVASSDQRLLIVVAGEKQETAKPALQKVLNGKEMIGRFHLDFVDAEVDKELAIKPKDKVVADGIMIIQPDQYGQVGTLLKALPLTATDSEIAAALTRANQQYAEVEQRKNYYEHVKQGRADGIDYANVIPYGEDRDGDGEIDPKGPGHGKGKGKGGRKGKGAGRF